jgi:uncharacterized phage-associated protein
MHDARAVSNFFFNRATDAGTALTVMTLLKVLYFAHAWHLAKTGNPLIAQPFEAWKHGPVNRVVYEQYKGYGKKPIDKPALSYDPSRLDFAETTAEFDQSTQKFLCNIFDYYARFDPFKLSDLTHEDGGPWHTIWTEAQNRAVPGMVIPNNLILSWFQRDRGAISYEA